LRVAFFGTPEASIPTLRTLVETDEVAGVVTRPDRPKGRSGTPTPSPVAAEAMDLGLPVHRPEMKAELADTMGAIGPIDVAVVVAFGMIIPPDVLSRPARGFVNVHFSLLPRWRGAAPVERAILAGDDHTGVSIMVMDEGLDTGPILAEQAVRIGPDEGTGTLTDRLATTGARLLGRVLAGWVSGTVEATPQPSDGATYAAKITHEDRRLEVRSSTETVIRVIRASHPDGATARYDGAVFKIVRAAPSEATYLGPGELAVTEGQLMMGTGDGAVELLEVQPAGKRPMDAVAWARGRHSRLSVVS